MVLVHEKENESDVSCVKLGLKIRKLPVKFHRAVCIHSSLQFIDLLMQSLMYTHGFSSTPVISQDSQGQGRTLVGFEKIRTELCAIFRSKHRKSVSEVAIFIGASPMRPNFTYQVPIEVCDADDSTDLHCGDTCASLNDNERRKINRDLFMLRQTSSDIDDKHLRAKNNRMFIFVKGNDQMVGESVEEEDPNFCSKSPNHSKYTFTHDKCTCERGIHQFPPENSGKWLRIVPFVVHSRD